MMTANGNHVFPICGRHGISSRIYFWILRTDNTMSSVTMPSRHQITPRPLSAVVSIALLTVPCRFSAVYFNQQSGGGVVETRDMKGSRGGSGGFSGMVMSAA